MLPRRAGLIVLVAAASTFAAPAGAQAPALNSEPSAPSAPLVFAPAAAQQAPGAASATTPATTALPSVPVGPALGAAAVGLRPTRQSTVSLTEEEAALQRRARSGFSQSQVLMIVGGAALITGLIIGDDVGDVLAIGGAGVGLFGLYRYLQGR